MKRIECKFGGGYSTVLLSAKTGSLYDYEQDRILLHNEYGGKQYYSSKTGLSGAGWLPGDTDLIALRSYRTDAPLENIPEGPPDYKDLDVFVPAVSHAGISCSHSVIVRRHRQLCYVKSNRLKEVLRSWNSLAFQRCQYYGEDYEVIVVGEGEFHPSFSERVGRFLPKPHFPDRSRESVVLSAMHIYNQEGTLVHTDPDGYVTQEFRGHPLLDNDVVDMLPEGWVYGSIPGFVYRRERDTIHMFLELRRDVFQEKLGKYREYELRIDLLEFYSQELPYWEDEIRRLLEEKTNQENEYWESQRRTEEERKNLLAQYPDATVSIEDSVKCGNCREGSLLFCRQFHLPMEIAFAKLLEHPQIEEMLQNYSFVRVLDHKLKTLQEVSSLDEVE